MSGSIKIFKEEYKDVFLFCLSCGFISHGAIFFYKYAWHDDTSALFGILSYGFGRWMTTVCGGVVAKLTSGWNYSVPLLNGFLTLLVIAVSCCFVLKFLDIRSKCARYGLAAIFVAFPVVTGTFGYMFLAPYYFLALLFSVIGVYFVAQERPILWFAGCFCLGIVPAFYQAYIGCFLSLMLLWMMSKVYRERISWKEFFCLGLRMAGASIISIFIYYAGLRICLAASGSSLTSYEGIGDVGSTDLSTYINGIGRAYRFFFMPGLMRESYTYEYAYMFPFGIEKFYYGILLIGTLLVGCLLFKKEPYSVRHMLQGLALTVLLPATCNFIFIMCPSQNTMIHSVMVYPQVFLFCYVALCSEILREEKVFSKERFARGLGVSLLNKCAIFLISVVGCLYIMFDNATYLRMQLQYQQVSSDVTTMVACIKMTEGYESNIPIAFVVASDYNHIERNIPRYQELAHTLYINPYNLDYMYPFLAQGSLINFMKNTCGFMPVIYDDGSLVENADVQAMPVWPDFGSIRLYTVDGNKIIIVKI